MNTLSFSKFILVSSLLQSECFTLNKRLCITLGISSGKCALHNLRQQIQKNALSYCSPLENLPTNEGKGLREHSVKVLIARHFSEESTSFDFNTSDIHSLRTIPRSTIAKAIRELLRDGRIEVLDAERRPKVYRWIPEERPDPIDVFIKLYSIGSVQSSFHLNFGLLPCHLNRALCGLPYLGDNLVERAMKRISALITNNNEINSSESDIRRLLPYVISSGGDYRVFSRRVEEEIVLAKNIRKLLLQVDIVDSRRGIMENRGLSESLITLLERENSIRCLYDGCRYVCGDEIHRVEVNTLMSKIVSDMCQQFSSLSYDETTSTLVSKEPIDIDGLESALTKTIRMYKQNTERPMKKVNVKDIYRVASIEIKRRGWSI